MHLPQIQGVSKRYSWNGLETSSSPGLVLTHSLKPRTSGAFQIHIEVPHILKELKVKFVKLLGGDCV